MTSQHLYILGPNIDMIHHAAREAGYSRRDIRPITAPDHLRGIRDLTIHVIYADTLRKSMADTITYHQQTGRLTFQHGLPTRHDSSHAEQDAP